jgi:predicted permease
VAKGFCSERLGQIVRVLRWLDSLRADAVFGWRQIKKRKLTSAAAILSLAVGIGACTAAFRLVDATLWRPLPINAPERLYVLSREITGPDGKVATNDNCAYPMFRQMRSLVRDQAELIAVSNATRIDLTYGSDQEVEKAFLQYVSGWMFGSFGIRPVRGRVLNEGDDRVPGAHPYAVISYDYWRRRFGEDPKVIGRTFRTGADLYQIVGVAEGPFTGTEPGTVTDIFVPTMMRKEAIARSDYRWFRTFVLLKPGVSIAPVREKLRAAFHGFLQESAKDFTGSPRQEMEGYLSQKLRVSPAPAGASGMQERYGTALTVLGVLVALVLLISCANVANLMAAQTTARQREIALRVSIGAGRGRLVQLVIVECAWLSVLAAGLGAVFAWWAAPFVVGRLVWLDNPVRLMLPADWRVLGFGLAMALGVTILFGLAPALRVSRVQPALTLKGGANPHQRLRMMQVLIAVQVAFGVLVIFVAALFTTTAGRLSRETTGFSDQRLLTLETLAAQAQPAPLWENVAEHLRSVQGVEAVAICEWPLMAGETWNGFISVNGAPPSPVASYFLSVSPAWREVMKIPLLAGRDFLASDTLPGSALVNATFARQFLGSENPVGRAFEVVSAEGPRFRFEIVGVVGDARYQDMREPVQPTAYFPLRRTYRRATFIVRTSNPNPLVMASLLRQEVPLARVGFRVSNIRTQKALVEQQTVRERLLATLGLFFGVVVLLLVGVGLYGVLDFSVHQQWREIGIRRALGAPAGSIVQSVAAKVYLMVVVGTLAGLGLGAAAARSIEFLFYQVKPNDPGMLVLPAVTILAVTLAAALPPVIRAVHVDPATTLRAE